MKILLQSVQICDKNSPHHNSTVNVLIHNGNITYIGSENQDSDKLIDCKGKFLSPGWFDMRANFCDPGYEHKEDIESGSLAAASGGFTEVALLPNTKPVVQSKNDIAYIRSKNHSNLTSLHPMAAVTINAKGEELTEMIDLYEAGAIAFTDGEKPVWHSDILLKTLLYLQKFDGLLINKPEDKFLTLFGVMNESINSTMLGMKGMPKLAEELMIMRDLRILEYTGGRIHFSNISTKEGVALIREAKSQGLSVTCDIAAHQIAFDDNSLHGFDTNFKVNPPLREQSDIVALKAGLEDGTIDAVVSSHSPQDEESKKLEFDLAEFGILGLQTLFPILLQEMKNIDLILEKIVYQPRNILKLTLPVIRVGEKANLTLFDLEKVWTFNENTNFSKSLNSPFYGQSLKGKAVGVFNGDKFFIEGGNQKYNGIESAIS
jgi:dihydroorotase